MANKPQRLDFSVEDNYGELFIDILNLQVQSEPRVQGSLIVSRINKIVEPFMHHKADQINLSSIKSLLNAWAARLEYAGFKPVEYVSEGRWLWEGPVVV